MLACVGLADVEGFEVYTDFFCVDGVEGVFHVDEGADAAPFLGFCDHVETEGGFAAGFGAVDFYDSAARNPPHTERNIEGERASGDGLYDHVLRFAEAHDGAFTEFFLDACEGGFEDFVAAGVGVF